jgi:hypothetical protein
MGISGLAIYDLQTPTLPIALGAYDSPGTALGIVVEGTLAYIADGSSGLRVVDVSDPTAPVSVGNYDPPGGGVAVAVSGDLAILGDGVNGIWLVDVSNPAAPALIVNYNSPGGVTGVAIDGDRAIVADGTNGVLILDISNPAAPTLIGSYDTGGNARDVEVSGNLLLVADEGAGFVLLDISDPALPQLIDSYDTSGSAVRLTLAGNLAYVADSAAGLQVLAFTESVLPQDPVPFVTSATSTFGVALYGDLALVGAAETGLILLDVSDPNSPVELAVYDTPNVANEVEVALNRAYLADGTSGLLIFDIQNPVAPALLGSYDTPDFASGVEVVGNHAFIADTLSGLFIVDVSDPAAPAFVGGYDPPGGAQAIVVDGDLALLADAVNGLHLVDISNLSAPALLATFDTDGVVYDVAVSGDLAYVADGFGGLVVVHIGAPTTPYLFGSHPTGASAQGIVVDGDLVAIANGFGGIMTFDVRVPWSPAPIGSSTTSEPVYALAQAGEHVFAVGGSALQTVQIYQHELSSGQNQGVSLPVNGGEPDIRRVRLFATQSSGVSWEVRATTLAPWQAIPLGSTWVPLQSTGDELSWRSTHAWSQGINPTVTDLQIEWLVSSARLVGIQDIPNDQGGWLRLNIQRSARDFDDAGTPVTSYGVWRRVDDRALLEAIAVRATRAEPLSEFGEQLALVDFAGRRFHRASAGKAASFPPGVWEHLSTLPAVQQDVYLAAVPTAADSTSNGDHETVLVVTTHTLIPSQWYITAPDSASSLDNLAPGVPQNLGVAYYGGANSLSWDASNEEDFQYFRIYRGTAADFTPSPDSFAHATVATEWSDAEHNGVGVHYKVTALDHTGNESAPAVASTTTASDALPSRPALHAPIPNPFNPLTTIEFELALTSEATLAVYDLAGRRVRQLERGILRAGRRQTTWDGRDDRGESVASGVYIVRLESADFAASRRVVLLK